MTTTKERLKKFGIDSEDEKHSIVISILKMIGNETDETTKQMVCGNSPKLEWLKFAIESVYMYGVFDGQLMEMKEEFERFKNRTKGN